MSRLATEPILARTASSPLRGPFSAYWKAAPALSPEPMHDLTAEASRGLLSLPMISIATLRYEAPPYDTIEITTQGVVTEASLRLAWWVEKRNPLTGHAVAANFEDTYFPTGRSGWRRGLSPLARVPRKGWALLAATDRLGSIVRWYLDIPSERDWRRFDTVRLKDALDALD